VTHGERMMSLSASLQHQARAAFDRVSHITLNRKLSCIFYAKLRSTKNYRINLKSGVNFQVALKQNCVQRDLSVH